MKCLLNATHALTSGAPSGPPESELADAEAAKARRKYDTPRVVVVNVETIHDGDTVRAREPGIAATKHDERVRLQWIDTPELKQHYGPQAREALVALVKTYGRADPASPGDYLLWLVPFGQDKYDRTMGGLFPWAEATTMLPSEKTFERSINYLLVVLGFAWLYSHPVWHAGRHENDDGLMPLERAAKAGGLGLWAAGDDAIMPRWWRRGDRVGATRHLPPYTEFL